MNSPTAVRSISERCAPLPCLRPKSNAERSDVRTRAAFHAETRHRSLRRLFKRNSKTSTSTGWRFTGSFFRASSCAGGLYSFRRNRRAAPAESYPQIPNASFTIESGSRSGAYLRPERFPVGVVRVCFKTEIAPRTLTLTAAAVKPRESRRFAECEHEHAGSERSSVPEMSDAAEAGKLADEFHYILLRRSPVRLFDHLECRRWAAVWVVVAFCS